MLIGVGPIKSDIIFVVSVGALREDWTLVLEDSAHLHSGGSSLVDGGVNDSGSIWTKLLEKFGGRSLWI